jgi:hypothetical protein
LSNTRLRLEQLYGSAGRLALKGLQGSGAEVIVTVPRNGGKSESAR